MNTRKQKCPVTTVGYSDNVMAAPSDWHLDFAVQSARVRTATDEGEHFVHIELESNLDDAVDSALEVARYARPLNLILQGVLSFFSGAPVTVYDFHCGTRKKGTERRLSGGMSVSRFEMGGRDLKGDAEDLLTRLQSETNGFSILASVLDRWRRGCYLAQMAEEENEDGGDSLVSAEEIFLHYFHVIELLSNESLNKAEDAVKTRVRSFLSEFYADEVMLVGNALTQKVADRFAVLYPMLSEDMSATTKALRILSGDDAAEPRVRAFVGELVKVRNAIAHGRAVFRPKVMWPLPAFFPLHEKTECLLPSLRIFAAHLIAGYCGVRTWNAEWNEVKAAIPATPEEIRKLHASGSLARLSPQALITGNQHCVTLVGLVEQYFDRQIDFPLFENITEECLLSVRLSEEISTQMLYVAAILADSSKEKISQRAKAVVKKIVAKRWEPNSNLKDLFRYAEYKDRPLRWYRDWFAEGGACHARQSP